MKKSMIVFLFCNLLTVPCLFAQSKEDSVARELERLRRLGDSLHREQLKRDSAFQETLNNIAKGVDQTLQEANQKQLEEATAQVMKQHEKEQKAKQKTMMLALLGFLATVSVAGIFFKRRMEKNKPAT